MANHRAKGAEYRRTIAKAGRGGYRRSALAQDGGEGARTPRDSGVQGTESLRRVAPERLAVPEVPRLQLHREPELLEVREPCAGQWPVDEGCTRRARRRAPHGPDS